MIFYFRYSYNVLLVIIIILYYCSLILPFTRLLIDDPEDVSIESSLEEQIEEDEPEFWQQPPSTESHTLMSSICKGMKKIFRGQIRLRRQVEKQNARLERIKESLWLSR